MSAASVIKFLPQICSCASKLSSGSLRCFSEGNGKALFLHHVREWSSSSSISSIDSTLRKHIDTLEEKYAKSVAENRDFRLELGEQFKDSLDTDSLKDVLGQIVQVRSNMSVLHELNTDKNKEMDALVKEEMKEFEDQLTELHSQLLEALTPKDEEEYFKNIIVEVSTGVGGQESMLFAKEIYDMYNNYAKYRGWSREVIEMSTTELGGIRRACVLVSGDECSLLRFEGGVHRVQRIPKTEKSGRVHTSTITVAVLPQPTETHIVLNDKDLKVEFKRASGPGGQGVQKSESAVRIVHLPTGIAVETQQERTQMRNKALAMTKLRALLYEKEKEEKASKISSSRKIQIGSRGRSEKIRTYNYNQDRVTDHRIGKNMFDLTSFLEGGPALDEMIQSIYENYRREQLETLLEFLTSR